jgi:hypothetical protein
MRAVLTSRNGGDRGGLRFLLVQLDVRSTCRCAKRGHEGDAEHARLGGQALPHRLQRGREPYAVRRLVRAALRVHRHRSRQVLLHREPGGCRLDAHQLALDDERDRRKRDGERDCVMMTAVHTPPKRGPPPPAVPCRSRAPRPRVILSAGSTPAMAAPSSVSPPA